MARFAYHRPTTLSEALGMLADLGPGAVPVAGATDVWVNLRAGKIAPQALVSLRGVRELAGLHPSEHGLLIGACTPHADVEDSAWVAERLPALHQACSQVGSRQIRNVGTVGGNLCNAAPSADSAVALLLYDAECRIQGPEGHRSVPLAEFFAGPGSTVLGPGELLVEIRVPVPEGGRTFSGYRKLTRRKAMELPILGVGARVTVDESGVVTAARIALGVAGPTPCRAPEAERILEGERLGPEVVRAATDKGAHKARVCDSRRGEAGYRREMIRVLIPRILEEAGAW